MPYALNTVGATKLKEELVTFIETLRTQFPSRRHVHVSVGAKHKTGTRIEIYTQADERGSHQYTDPETGRLVLEEFHRVAIDVKADAKAGGSEVVEAVYGVLKAALAGAVKSGVLLDQGIYDLRESAEAPDYGALTFERPLNLTCNTDVYLT